MKWSLACLSLAVLTLLLLTTALLRGWLPLNHSVFDTDFTGTGVEFGLYDLEDGHSELYVPFFAVKSDSVLMTLTSPVNSQFIAKILLVPQTETRTGMLYSYKPIVVHAGKNQPLAQSVFNFLSHNGVTYDRVRFEGSQMLVTPSGLIINQQQ
ncbi:hypothetical protein [Pantoea sp.]|uniref:hypothetical protein n=1 Tax=Pantoea sp. TaxID=69393 RepID=UPI0031DB6F65